MRLLFAITVGCFCALMWVALSLARRIRLAQMLRSRALLRPDRQESRGHSKQEFFEAGEFRTPRPLRLEQEILQQKPRRHLSEISFTSELPDSASADVLPSTHINQQAIPDLTSKPIPIRQPAAAYASLFGETIAVARLDRTDSVSDSDSNRLAIVPDIPSPAGEYANDTATMNAVPGAQPLPFTLHRKPPQSVRPSGLRRRVDLSHFNHDMGDLTDPYTHPLRGSGTQGPVPTKRPNS